MSGWAGTEAEIEGVKKAARNVEDLRPFAAYVYHRICEYRGPVHADVAIDMIAAAIEARSADR